jgi:hypothetical protein
VRSFKDAKSTAWDVSVNVSIVRAVRARCNIDLATAFEDGHDGKKPAMQILADPVLLVDILSVVCERQIIERGMTPEDFGRLFDNGDIVNASAEALLYEMVDFCPSQKVREALRVLLAKSRQLVDMAGDRAMAMAEGIEPKKELEKLIASSTASPGSSASTQDRSP